MGRTVPSFRIALESEISTWGEFRGALGHQSKDLLDGLFNQARTNCASAGMAIRPVVFEGMLMAMLHSHELSLAKIAKTAEEVRLMLEGRAESRLTAATAAALEEVPGENRKG